MSAPRTVEIVGGGLAGLALGLGLRNRGVPVVVYEASDYPRHRVCGDFITGLPAAVAAELGIASLLADARRHRSLVWFRGAKRFAADELAEAALGVDRYRLDASLAAAFVALGGRLITGVRRSLDDLREGQVAAAGRRRGGAGWIGLKLHALDLPLAADLELHLGRRAYVGACALGDGRVNLCGLFADPRTPSSPEPAGPFVAALQRAGLASLAERVTAAGVDRDSVSAVAGLAYSGPGRDDGTVRIGDAYALIPPFTGHGMAMAFLGAQLAVEPLQGWSLGRGDWTTTARSIRRRLDAAFRRRLAAARVLHRFVLLPAWQAVFARLHGAGLLPFSSLYRLLH
jgi:menaquinone-9 beta-reductase